MLDQETKRKIDNARDILVGKVPDPKSQVEQITIALIYKFMDDMDKKSEEWGGVATFFTGEFDKYAWTKIFDPRLSGFELITLYGEALLKMNQNPNIPQLFRDIFKNAFLPYRDPETLKSFLKEINEFNYDHSERLGDAFEYLLSVMDAQGDAGQFRTPRHIIDFIVAIVNPKKNETIADPACGTAGFLISSYKQILKENTKTQNGDQLTPDERKRLIKNITGYDISPDMVRLSLVNLYLHGFSDPNIVEYDTLTSEERWNETFDVVLANPPFMTPKGGIRPHKRFSIQAKRSEVLFVDYIAEHLNPNGRAGVIVPEGIIFQSQNAYKNLRKMLVENYLWAVVSLPSGIFQPYSGVKTSIILMDKTLAKRTDKILFVKIENDGFDLGAQRRAIDKNDLPKALAYLRQYRDALMSGIDFEENKFTQVVKKTKIVGSGDWNLSGERYRAVDKLGISNYEVVELGEISEIISGQSPEGKYYNKIGEGTPFYQGKTDFTDRYIGEPQKWTNSVTKTAIKDDILMSVRAPVGPVNIATGKICIGRGLSAIRANKKVNKFYLFHMLRFMGDNIKGSGGAVFDSISRAQIKSLQIPFPPLDVQKTIVDEIEGCQKIIDGARQVVENYKPTINIDPEWEMVKLGSVLKKVTDSINPKENSGMIKYIGLENIESDLGSIAGDLDTEISSIKSTKTKFKKGEILYGKLRPNLNKVYFAEFAGICSTDIFVLKGDESILKLKFYAIYLRNKDFNKRVLNGISGSQLPRVSWDYFSKLLIPLPIISAQKNIVAQIEVEQDIVNANKKLIALFEKKIKDKISEVWGE